MRSRRFQNRSNNFRSEGRSRYNNNRRGNFNSDRRGITILIINLIHVEVSKNMAIVVLEILVNLDMMNILLLLLHKLKLVEHKLMLFKNY